MKRTDIEFYVRLLVMIISLTASFATKDVIESQFLISLSIMSGLSLIRQISDYNKITVKNGK
jgi:general stress protein CsbA